MLRPTTRRLSGSDPAELPIHPIIGTSTRNPRPQGRRKNRKATAREIPALLRKASMVTQAQRELAGGAGNIS